MDVAIVFLPLLGAVVTGLLGRRLGDTASELITCALVAASAVLSVVVFFDVAVHGHVRTTPLFTWMESGSLQAEWSLRVDQLTAVMLVVVNVVSSMVHIYSIGYMHHDKSIPRFFCYLNLFTFAMLMLVTADNLVQLFFGWEGVGLCSYLLVGFWYDRPSANAAAIKAFIVNRIADLPFAVGLALIFLVFGSLDFSAIFPAVSKHAPDTYHLFGTNFPVLEVIGVLLFIGAMG